MNQHLERGGLRRFQWRSARCRRETTAPNHSTPEEKIKPRCKPCRSLPAPSPSAIQPTTAGPAIWPAANTMVKALMPAAHWLCGRLCRTSAVVLATSDKNTPPNITPDNSTSGHTLVMAGINVAQPSSAFKTASACPPLNRSSKPAQTRDDAMTATPSVA